MLHLGRDNLLVRAQDSLSKGCEFESWQERRENFLLHSQLCALTLIQCPFHPRVIAVARKRPRSFCQNCRWQVTPKHAYAFDPTKTQWADYAVQAWGGSTGVINFPWIFFYAMQSLVPVGHFRNVSGHLFTWLVCGSFSVTP